MLLHAYDQYEAAATCYDRARELSPATFAWAYLAGVARSELSAYDKAIPALQRARDLDGSSLAARLRLADVLFGSGDLAGSLAEYRSVLTAYPELALAHYGAGRALYGEGKTTDALQEYHAAVTLAPAFGAAHYALALAYRDEGSPVLATEQLAAFRQVGTRKPVFPDPLMDEVRTLRGTARELIVRAAQMGRAGRLDEAIALHLEALAADPNSAQAHVNLISLYARTGRPELAERHYRDALRLGSSLADAHYNFGVLMASQGRDQDAAWAFQRALDIDPFHARAHNNLGALLARAGNRNEALQHFREALASDPQYTTARFALGRVLVDLGRPADAVEQFKKLAELPENSATPGYMFALAAALYASGSAANGIQRAQEAERGAWRYGQLELARTIARELVLMQAGRHD